MKLYLHIGTEKTGTTTIQEALYFNRALLSQRGYHFLQSAGERNNRALPSICMNGLDDFFHYKQIFTEEDKHSFCLEFYQKFAREIESLPKNIHSVVISSEHFHSRLRSFDEIAKLREVLSKYFSDITIICYLREQMSVCNSLYSTAIKAGNTLAFEELLSSCVVGNVYYNYSDFLSLWERVFFDGFFEVRLFNKRSFVNNELIDDFFYNLDPKLINEINKDITNENSSISVEGAFIGCALNRVSSINASGLINENERVKLINYIYSIYRGGSTFYDNKQAKRVYDEFYNSNEIIRQKFFSNVEEPLFSLKRVNKSNLESFDVDKLAGFLTHFFYSKLNIPESLINSIRDLAIENESTNLQLSHFLMKLAHSSRPDGEYIKNKLDFYNRKLNR